MTIYLISSEILTRTILADFLTDLGHQVTTFGFMQSAVGDCQPDVLIVDGVGLAAWEGIEQVHGRYPDSPVIGILDRSSRMTAEKALECGVHACLHPPFDLEELELILLHLSENGRGPG